MSNTQTKQHYHCPSCGGVLREVFRAPYEAAIFWDSHERVFFACACRTVWWAAFDKRTKALCNMGGETTHGQGIFIKI